MFRHIFEKIIKNKYKNKSSEVWNGGGGSGAGLAGLAAAGDVPPTERRKVWTKSNSHFFWMAL
jgi:hypothetical protein